MTKTERLQRHEALRQQNKFLSDEEVAQILDTLPHGSGIDSTWRHHTKGLKDVFTNSLHCMDENGYYDGWQDFQVIVFAYDKDVLNPLKGPCEGQTQVCWRKGDRDFKIQFTGQRRQKYIENWTDALYDYMSEALGKFGIGRMRQERISAPSI